MDWKSPQVAALGAKLLTTTAVMLGFISVSDSSRLENVLAAALVACVGLVANVAAVIHFNHTQQPQADASAMANVQRAIVLAKAQHEIAAQEVVLKYQLPVNPSTDPPIQPGGSQSTPMELSS